MKKLLLGASAMAAAVLAVAPATAQDTAQMDFESVGRGWPLAADVRDYDQVGPRMIRSFGPNAGEPVFDGGARGGEVPEGIEPLPVDVFTSTDFYADKEYWLDQRYYRCNSGFANEEQWGAFGRPLVEGDDPSTGAWGHCDKDYPREAIVSPYPFETAQEHYQALLEETEARGGPTEHTYATVPGEWSGVYGHPGMGPYASEHWYFMQHNQISTIMTLLTPEYQQRVVQQTYHTSHTNAPQWQSQYCWPEGFMRRWHMAATWEHYVLVTPHLVEVLAGVARNFITRVHIGREFNTEGVVPRLDADVPRWYGETVGFWDGDALITWTSNVQAWQAHSAFEWSNKLQTIEIYTPNYDSTGAFEGLNHEAIIYDPEALVEPIRIVRNLTKINDYEDPGATPYVFIECAQTIFPIEGRSTPVSIGETIEYTVPDLYGRPWADIWEKYFEQDMDKPVDEDMFNFE